MNSKSLEQSSELLLGCAHPLLVTHISPDGDAAGSLLGLGWILRSLGIEPVMACEHSLPYRFDFLPGFDQVVQDVAGDFDLVVSLDCSDTRRMGKFGVNAGAGAVPLINIDHHRTNLEFGTVNLVDPEAASTTEVLYRLALQMGVAIDERIATCLLAGLVTDTRGLRTSNVDADVLRVAVALIEAGAPLSRITQNGLDRRPLGSLRLWGEALARLEFSEGVIWTSLPIEVQRSIGNGGYGDIGISSLLVSAEEANVSAVFTERDDGWVEVGFRAVPGFDVSGVALEFGGGGHALASGCLVPGPLEEARERVLGALRADLARQETQPNL